MAKSGTSKKYVSKSTKFPPLPEGYVWGDVHIKSRSPDIRLKDSHKWIVTLVHEEIHTRKNHVARPYFDTYVGEEKDIDLGTSNFEKALEIMATMFELGAFNDE